MVYMEKIEVKEISSKYKTKKLIKWILIGISLIVFYFVYAHFNPYKVDFFPKCPFLWLTGYKCPGCGSQRAIHYLFNFDIYHAFKENMLLVISIPYLIVGAWFDTIAVKTEKQLRIRKFLFGQKAIMVILVLVIGFWILRNVF
jgi:hypothetical protein